MPACAAISCHVARPVSPLRRRRLRLGQRLGLPGPSAWLNLGSVPEPRPELRLKLRPKMRPELRPELRPERLPQPGPRLLPALLLCSVLALGGCAGVAPQRTGAPPLQTAPPAQTQTPTQAPAPAGFNARTQAAEVLAIEQQWLQGWFRGTPVRITQRSDGSLGIDVPREFCFDAGRSRILPALSAVLDKVAQSLHRRPTARLTLLAGPADSVGAAGAAALGMQRATGMQRQLREHGITLARLGEPTAEGSTGVQLRISMPAP